MAPEFDIAVFIGRFQPVHAGHLEVIKQALEKARYVVVLVGSASSPRCYRNPFTFDERADMIRSALPGAHFNRVRIKPLEDSTYNDSRWIQSVQTMVTRTAWEIGFTSEPTVTLIGHSKDRTSYYLRLFPQWDSIEVANHQGVNGTEIRKAYFDEDPARILDVDQEIVPGPVRTFLESFSHGKDYQYIKSEYEHIRIYRKGWEVAPYPPTFVTVDCVVVQSGHVLLVRRRAAPGKGLWAMPGGFIGPDELIQDAAIRELREETGIKVPEPVLRGSIVARDVFDDPNRSARGRTITHAFLVRLRDDTILPKVKGMDDADKARWVPISELKPEHFFEDHYSIVQNLLARI